ncbi:MAG: flagellar basal body rod protein FlgB [Candidatus Velthaea sp.]|jgi:flagellar basal-body rod protein FlgB
MSGISFGQTIGMLENAMSGSTEAHAAIANNIANVATPNFHRTDVSFKDALAQSEATLGDPEAFAMETNDPRQIAVGGPAAGEPFSITTTVDDSEQMRVDGSNVDIDQEMAKLSLNSSYAQRMAQLMTNSFTRIKDAIQEHA